MHFVDSHVHLCEYPDYLLTLRMARTSETLLLSSGIDRATSLTTLEVAKEAPPIVKAFVGTHPSEAQAGANLEWFAAALRRAKGAGELGLDPKYSEVTPHSAQMKLFVRQLDVVEKAGKPVQVHSRGAEKECLAILSSYRVNPVLMHWFQNENKLREAEDRGYYFSFGPALLGSKKLQKMASSLDPTRVLVESDGPVTFRPLGGAGGPSLIPSVVFKLAELWRRTFAEAKELLLRNSCNYLDGREDLTTPHVEGVHNWTGLEGFLKW